MTNPLHPVVVQYLLDLLTERECDELDAYCSADSAVPELYCLRANEWLRRRFANLTVLELTAEDGVRRSQRAGMN